MNKPKIGLLPFYLKLYDELVPERRAGFESYVQTVATAFEGSGIVVEQAPVCRVATEFEAAIQQFESLHVDCIVTLHLAYSPSLESLDVFCRSRLPIIILDTTMDYGFGLTTNPERIMYNHGVHGVMDFASMLGRRGRKFEIVAGHLDDNRLLPRAVDLVRAAAGADSLAGSRLLRVGEAFRGMGDFSVDPQVLARKFGFKIDQVGLDELDQAISGVEDSEVATEVSLDRELYQCDLAADVHVRSVRVGLGLRHLLQAGGYQGMSVNFQAFKQADRPANTMPFLEIAKAMARGIGYAGEGDLLTAALVGALARVFGVVTFTEIFCADWEGNSLFLSHMGEISPAVAAAAPRLFSKPLLGGVSLDPAVLTCAVRPGPAVYVNLAPGPDDRFSLIVVPVEVLPEGEQLAPAMHNTVRAWIRPSLPVGKFLEKYSRAGGTHHSALVLGDRAEAVAGFGRMANLEVVRIDG